MSTRWRILDLSQYSGDIGSGSGRIRAGHDDFPLADVACILTGPDTRWSGAFVEIAARYGVPIIACDWRGVPHATTLPWSSNTRVAARHLAQAALSLPRQKNAWMHIIRAKIKGQSANLPPGDVHHRLETMAGQVRSGDPNNLEAQAAKIYWAHVFAPDPFRRDPRGAGRNGPLNYGYAVLRGVVGRAIVAAGLSPTLAIHHRNRSNCFALADDLIEPFRPAIDSTVQGLANDASPSESPIKALLVATLAIPMGAHGATVQTEITALTSSFARYVEGEIDKLPVPTWQGDGG
jgi:CRISPR-associated protein Cas1